MISLFHPYDVPAFKPREKPEPIDRFFWWSWHPRYPYWSKSCWGAPTEVKAKTLRESDNCGGLNVYHNKLIRENNDGTLTEICDDPVRRPEIWKKIAELPRMAKDAVPIK